MQIIARHDAISGLQVVAATVRAVTGMQWLMNITNKMHQKCQRLQTDMRGQGLV